MSPAATTTSLCPRRVISKLARCEDRERRPPGPRGALLRVAGDVPPGRPAGLAVRAVGRVSQRAVRRRRRGDHGRPAHSQRHRPRWPGRPAPEGRSPKLYWGVRATPLVVCGPPGMSDAVRMIARIWCLPAWSSGQIDRGGLRVVNCSLELKWNWKERSGTVTAYHLAIYQLSFFFPRLEISGTILSERYLVSRGRLPGVCRAPYSTLSNKGHLQSQIYYY